MTQQHPIPSPELVYQWVAEIWHEGTPVRVSLSDEHVATRAAQWGADQELEACLNCMNEWGAIHNSFGGELADDLRAARRPKPPSLKRRALIHFDSYSGAFNAAGGDSDLIFEALESIPDPS